MDLVPKRHSLVAGTTALLREAIAVGRWSGLLPGERKLCQQMQVGRDTLRAAVLQLEREGLVSSGEAGKQRKILNAGAGPSLAAGLSAGVIAFLSPHRLEQFSDSLLVEVDVLRERLAGSGYRLEVVTGSKVFTQSQPAKALLKLTADYAAEAWILHRTTAPMQRWFAEKGPPSLLHGQPQGVQLPAVDIDYTAVGRHAGGFLISRGHRDVVTLRPHASLRGLDMAEAGLREAFSGHSGEALPPPMTMRESEGGGATA
ncbi:MAG: GntR family transcriptional regulator, partial [Verrucomicrobiales bacterium]|nr:GntR family transcriptional regulator [Verrucomicrobiales bacterium]